MIWHEAPAPTSQRRTQLFALHCMLQDVAPRQSIAQALPPSEHWRSHVPVRRQSTRQRERLSQSTEHAVLSRQSITRRQPRSPYVTEQLDPLHDSSQHADIDVQVAPQAEQGEEHPAKLVQPSQIAHSVLHERQVSTLRRSASQPLLGSMSQSALVPGHIPQLPELQLPAGHTVEHAPQFIGSVSVFTSHPVLATPSQSAKPELHTNPQTRDVHVAVAFMGPGHGEPHEPQLATSSRRSVSQPLPRPPSQSPKLGSQVSSQEPTSHDPEAFGGSEHTLPHLPQFAASVASSASQPSAAPPMQSPKPLSQLKSHALLTQVGDALAGSAHAMPQPPQ